VCLGCPLPVSLLWGAIAVEAWRCGEAAVARRAAMRASAPFLLVGPPRPMAAAAGSQLALAAGTLARAAAPIASQLPWWLTVLAATSDGGAAMGSSEAEASMHMAGGGRAGAAWESQSGSAHRLEADEDTKTQWRWDGWDSSRAGWASVGAAVHPQLGYRHAAVSVKRHITGGNADPSRCQGPYIDAPIGGGIFRAGAKAVNPLDRHRSALPGHTPVNHDGWLGSVSRLQRWYTGAWPGVSRQERVDGGPGSAAETARLASLSPAARMAASSGRRAATAAAALEAAALAQAPTAGEQALAAFVHGAQVLLATASMEASAGVLLGPSLRAWAAVASLTQDTLQFSERGRSQPLRASIARLGAMVAHASAVLSSNSRGGAGAALALWQLRCLTGSLEAGELNQH